MFDLAKAKEGHRAARALDAAARWAGLPTYSGAGLGALVSSGRWGALASYLEAKGEDVDSVEPLYRRARAAYLAAKEEQEPGYLAFWSHGIRGWPEPEPVFAYRRGELPEGGRSFNYRDRFFEPGVSVTHLEREGDSEPLRYRAEFKGRPVVRVQGFWREDETGSDSEPLLVFASVAPLKKKAAKKV